MMNHSWHPSLNDLIPLLAGLYPDRDRARLLVRRAGLMPEDLDFTGAAKVFWLRIVEEANRRKLIENLIDRAAEDYPNTDFTSLKRQLRSPGQRLAPALKVEDWRGGPRKRGDLEKIIGRQPTFLPVSFLETGLERARTVARVDNPSGLGTGFLIRENVLITNHHVVPTPEAAAQTTLWFNYQTTAGGGEARFAEFSLDPARLFATSPNDGGDDWTAVAVKGDANRDWGCLELKETSVAVGDFVNIIQHPGGLPKQIALYHNLVAYADGSRLQYLTDTMPGSSGSPVFDSDWRLVALHHRGGWLPEPGSGKVYFRNQGIRVRALINGLKVHGLS